METFGYIAAILMGLSLGLIGGGGSILTVPILVYLFSVDTVLATAYSLFIVGVTALVGGVLQLRNRNVDIKTGVIFAAPSFVGVYLTRAHLVPALPDPVFSLSPTIAISKAALIMSTFAVLMLLASISMIRTKASTALGSTPKEQKTAGFDATKLNGLTRSLVIAVEGFAVGGITGFVGAGGGFLIIPALVLLVGLPMKKAIGTSLMIIAVKSLLGFVGDVQRQPEIDWIFLFSISGIAIAGLGAGLILSQKVSESRLKKGFGWFVLVMGTLILFDQIRRVL